MYVCNCVGGICCGVLDFRCCMHSVFVSQVVTFALSNLCQGFISGALANVPLSEKLGLGKVRVSLTVKIF